MRSAIRRRKTVLCCGEGCNQEKPTRNQNVQEWNAIAANTQLHMFFLSESAALNGGQGKGERRLVSYPRGWEIRRIYQDTGWMRNTGIKPRRSPSASVVYHTVGYTCGTGLCGQVVPLGASAVFGRAEGPGRETADQGRSADALLLVLRAWSSLACWRCLFVGGEVVP